MWTASVMRCGGTSMRLRAGTCERASPSAAPRSGQVSSACGRLHGSCHTSAAAEPMMRPTINPATFASPYRALVPTINPATFASAYRALVPTIIGTISPAVRLSAASTAARIFSCSSAVKYLSGFISPASGGAPASEPSSSAAESAAASSAPAAASETSAVISAGTAPAAPETAEKRRYQKRDEQKQQYDQADGNARAAG